jgi:hypothetical protein
MRAPAYWEVAMVGMEVATLAHDKWNYILNF